MSHASKNKLLARAEAFQKVRAFFLKRGVMEVDTPILSPYAPIDAHIDIFSVDGRFLHSCPEYAMKKLLADGVGDIYQLGHVFRKGEEGPLHTPEFTMIEWYRCGATFESFLQENVELCHLFLGEVPHEILSYREAFEKHLGLPHDAPPAELRAAAQKQGVEVSDDPDLLNLLWGCCIEPKLGQGCLSVVTHYPKEQAALARTTWVDGEEVSERFELYFQGIELGNGYHELDDPIEQRRRLEKANQERKALGKETFAIDPDFIAALEKGLPDCYGIALGFDRLLKLQLTLN